MNPPARTANSRALHMSHDADAGTGSNRSMNTFERNFVPDFPAFVEKVLRWNPHHVVPVAKKACKLLKTIDPPPALRRNPDLVKYRSFFELTNCSVKGKRIA